MAQLVRCDNKSCNKDIPEGASYIEVVQVFPSGRTFADDDRTKQYCSFGCVAEVAAVACGWVERKKP